MPLYDIKCSKSGKLFERIIPLWNFAEPIICSCGAPAIRVISTPLFSVDQTSYQCPVTGRYIGSKREHEENLRATGCRVLEEGEKEINARKRQEAEMAFESAVDATVEQSIESLPSASRERLYNEMTHSTVTVDRQ